MVGACFKPANKTATREGCFTVDVRNGSGPLRFLLLPGMVPDGPETFQRQEGLFAAYGICEIVTYPYGEFALDDLMELVTDFVKRQSNAGIPAVLVGVSIGGGFVLEWLRRLREAGCEPALAGIVLVSPLTCSEDISPLMMRLWKPIVDASGDSLLAVEKGRSFFMTLASRSVAGKEKDRSKVKEILQSLIPWGQENTRERDLERRIQRTLAEISSEGAVARCRALNCLAGIHVGKKAKAALTFAPTLVLWGSKERHTLNMEGPGSGALCRPDLAVRHFPNVHVHWIYDDKGGEVPHASLLKHSKAFHKPLKEFVERLKRAH